ncbi:tetratricopeptide repeat protein [Psychromicrobium lacuslunae]|uniref:Thioredoxin n=1 Tax=Psychromicrobium lacuslunae TaxID=1618207 RepID=A0A0D4BYW2_9MICC|nr:tetratricopeptide repeat protein [Psychromicrobium lacuslunae]AJT41335.1 thioredoxin [Psychromicrobium lacuslunae]
MTESASSAARGAGAPEEKIGANLRGAVDLSALRSAPTEQAPVSQGAPAQGGNQGFAVDATEASFPELVQLSAEVPVVVSMFASWSPQSQSVLATLERLIAAYQGRLLLARANIETFPQLAQAFGVQGVPAVVALVKGQPVPLFNGELGDAETRQYLEELLKVAAANGVDGTLGEAGAQAEEAPLPPLHQEAVDAIDAGNLEAAEAAYRKALAERPADAEAKAGLAQVLLMRRTEGLDAAAADEIRQQAAAQPDEVDAQLAVADLDLIGGHVEDALARVVGFIAAHFGPEREAARVRVLELFEVVGGSDPRVAKARQALARALF